MKENTTLQFITKGKINNDSINAFKEEKNINDMQLLRKSFKSLNGLIYDLSIENRVDIRNLIKRNIQLISFLCERIEFNEEEVIINIKRIKKVRESLLAYANKYKDFALQECANTLDEIILDKNVDVTDLLVLIKALVNKKEDPNVLKKFINANKGIIILEKCELFDYTFNLAINALDDYNNDIYYYITMLKLFYNSRIDKKKYLNIINTKICTEENDKFLYEIEMLIKGNKRALTLKEILEKYNFNTELPDQNIIFPNNRTNNDTIITIDDENTLLRDDAFSIRKDGNKYIIGIHIADGGKNIMPGSDVDIEAKNNFKCIYMCKGVRLLSSNIEYYLSLNQGKVRNAITLYVVMNDSGDILDYYIKSGDIQIAKNLTYDQCDSITANHSFKEIESIINTLYMISSSLENKDSNKREYWDKKNKARHIDSSPSKGEVITSELMVLYNTLIGYLATEKNIPYIFKYQEKEYISKLIKELNLKPSEEVSKIVNGIFLDSKYSSIPRWHSGLKKYSYSQSTDPLRKYPDLYSQYLLHKYYFKDLDFDIDQEKIEEMIDYFNQRNFEIGLMKAEYSRGLKLLKKD